MNTALNNQLAEQLTASAPKLVLVENKGIPEVTQVMASIDNQIACLQANAGTINLDQEMQKLGRGWVRGSKINNVNNVHMLKQMLSRVTKLLDRTDMADGTTAYRFFIPDEYTAVTCWVRLQELGQRRLVFKPKHNVSGHSRKPQFDCQIVVGYRLAIPELHTEDEAFFYAPDVAPIATNIVTFVVNTKENRLVKWLPGEDKERFRPTSDLKTHWVNCCNYPKEKYQPKAKNVPAESKLSDNNITLTPRPIMSSLPPIMAVKPKIQEEDEVSFVFALKEELKKDGLLISTFEQMGMSKH